MIDSKEFASALLEDYKKIQQKIDAAKVDAWRYPINYWPKILTNIMHMGSNSNTLKKREGRPEFKKASDFKSFKGLNQEKQRELFKAFVPGGHYISQDKKVSILIDACNYLSSMGIESLFSGSISKDKMIQNLTYIEGIGSKLARNIPMDLYHPAFRNGSIPIDNNWKKLGKILGFKWSDSNKHEESIIEWRDKYIRVAVV